MTVSPVAPMVPAGASSSSGSAGSSPVGLFAGMMGVQAPSCGPRDGSTGDASDGGGSSEEAAIPEAVAGGGAVELLSAAQIMAAAQVVPVTPVLAAALSLQATAELAQSAQVPQNGALATVTQLTVAAAPGNAQPVAGQAAPVGAEPLAGPTPEQSLASAGSGVVETPAASVVQEAPASGPGTGPGGEAGALTATAASAAGTGTGAQQRDARDERPSNPQPRVDAAGGATGAQGMSPTGALHAGVGREQAGPDQVTGQVFPEVARMVSRGDGTKRLTLKLSPEALGDVRVVLTVRNGEVHVRMAGGDVAQQALLAGAPELHRLLDQAGAASSQIVVGDNASTLDGRQERGSQWDGLQDSTTGHDGQNTDDRTAGTRDGDTSARDGSRGGPQPRSSTDPTATRGGATRTHPGVDVTM